CLEVVARASRRRLARAAVVRFARAGRPCHYPGEALAAISFVSAGACRANGETPTDGNDHRNPMPVDSKPEHGSNTQIPDEIAFPNACEKNHKFTCLAFFP